MLKRMLLVVLLGAAVLFPTTGTKAASAFVYKSISGLYINGPTILAVYGQTQEDLLGNTSSAYAQVSVQTSNGSDSGTGVLDVVLDPTGTIGSLSGTIQGTSGPITIDATYLSTLVTTTNLPYAAFFKYPGEPSVFATYHWYRLVGEFPTASVTSGVGNFDASGAGAQGYYQISVDAP